MKLNLGYKLGAEVICEVIRKDGSLKLKTEPIKNLVTNTGMISFFSTRATGRTDGDLTAFHHRGTGATPVNRSSGTTTATQTGTDVSASANVFEPSDVGRLVRWDSGEQAVVVTYTDSQNVVVDRIQSVSAAEFDIYYVNRSALGSSLGRTNSATGTNQVTLVGNDIVIQTVRNHASETSDRLINEIGLGGANSTDCGHIINLPAPISVLTGENLRTTATLRIAIQGLDEYASDPTTGEGNYAGNAKKQNRVAYVPNGSFVTGYPLGFTPAMTFQTAGNNGAFGIYVNTTQPTFTSFATPFALTGSSLAASSVAQGINPTSYPWTVVKTANFNTSSGNQTTGCVAVQIADKGTLRPVLLHVLTTPQAKSNLQTLSIALTFTADRSF